MRYRMFVSTCAIAAVVAATSAMTLASAVAGGYGYGNTGDHHSYQESSPHAPTGQGFAHRDQFGNLPEAFENRTGSFDETSGPRDAFGNLPETRQTRGTPAGENGAGADAFGNLPELRIIERGTSPAVEGALPRPGTSEEPASTMQPRAAADNPDGGSEPEDVQGAAGETAQASGSLEIGSGGAPVDGGAATADEAESQDPAVVD